MCKKCHNLLNIIPQNAEQVYENFDKKKDIYYTYTDENGNTHKLKTIKRDISKLSDKEEQLSKLEKEEKMIAEAEALLEKQKEGQGIGE